MIFLFQKKKKQELFDTGYNKTNGYLSEILPKKRKILGQKYKNLVDYIIKFQKEFNKSNTLNAYLKLCETFMFLCDEKKYIDFEVYNQLSSFKEEFLKNYKYVNFFGFKSAEVQNKEHLAKKLLDLIKIITIKIRELES